MTTTWDEAQALPGFNVQAAAVGAHIMKMMVEASDNPEGVHNLLNGRTMRCSCAPDDTVVQCWFGGTPFHVPVASFVLGAEIDAVETLDLIIGDPLLGD